MQKNQKSKIYIIDKTSFSNFFEAMIRISLLYYVKIKRCEVIRELVPGIALNFDYIENQKKWTIFYKIRYQFRNFVGLSHLIYLSKIFLWSTIGESLPTALNYQIVAGEVFEERVKQSIPKNVKLVKFHSLDYNEYLNSLKKTSVREIDAHESAIFLDAPEPYFFGDGYLSGEKIGLTTSIWYPDLNNFFNNLENKFKVRVKIMGHYKTNYQSPAPIFDNRKVVYGKTLEETKAAQFVVTINSSAISYAVLLRKPVLFIFSDEMKVNPKMLDEIYFLAKCLGTTPININDVPNNLINYLEVDEKLYANYEKNFLTSADNRRSNNEIILNEIIS